MPGPRYHLVQGYGGGIYRLAHSRFLQFLRDLAANTYPDLTTYGHEVGILDLNIVDMRPEEAAEHLRSYEHIIRWDCHECGLQLYTNQRPAVCPGCGKASWGAEYLSRFGE